MARPTKSIGLRTGHISKEEIEQKQRNEEALKGESDKIVAPSYLSTAQKNIFKNIVESLDESGILGNIDVYVLAQTAITINRIQECEKAINETGLFDCEGQPNTAVKVKTSYMAEFFKLCGELSLSPQARAKIANLNFKAQVRKEDPLLSILGGNE
ncbi:MAG: phage terminase small subunit P27 family [Clostridium sp.]